MNIPQIIELIILNEIKCRCHFCTNECKIIIYEYFNKKYLTYEKCQYSN